MARVTVQLLHSLQIAFNRAFQRGQTMARPRWHMVASRRSQDLTYNAGNWLNKHATLREWLGERVIDELQSTYSDVISRGHEASIEVEHSDIEDNMTGLYAALFEEMGQRAAMFPDKLVFPLLEAGFRKPCSDGRCFFDEQHPIYENADGSGAVDYVSNMADGSDPAWFLLAPQYLLKPLTYQEKTPMSFGRMDDLSDEAVMMSGAYNYGVKGHAAAGYGLWQTAYGSRRELSGESLSSAYRAMSLFSTDGARPLGIRGKLLVVRPEMKAQAREVLTSLTTESGIPQGQIELLVCDQFADEAGQ